jgi:hypothetical protein
MSDENEKASNATASSQPDPDSDILENADDPATEDPADPANTEVR